METALFIPIISVLFIVVAGALLFLGFAYRQLASQFEKLQAKTNQERSETWQKSTKMLDSAQEKSQNLLEKSEEKAQEIIVDAEFFTAAAQKELGQKIDEATHKHLGEYNQLLGEFRKELTKTFTKMSADLETGAGQELATFRQSIQERTKQMETDLQSQMTQNYQAAQDEIAAYKQAVSKKIDEQARVVIKEVVQEVVPKMISPSDHEALIIQALTEAKQSHAI